MILRCRYIVLLLLMPHFCLAADGPTTLVEPGPVVELGRVGVDWQVLFEKLAAPVVELGGSAGASWQALFEKLAGQGTVFAHFTENRWFPFKKIPVVLKGEMRMVPGRGLSLRYTEPDDRTMIVDDRGLLLRDDRGHSRAVPADPRSGNINAALLPVMRFDQKELAKQFLLHAARVGAAWRLDFEPCDAALAHVVGRITVWGEGEKVTQLEFRRSNSQRIEIIIDDSQTGAVFTEVELKRFFR